MKKVHLVSARYQSEPGWFAIKVFSSKDGAEKFVGHCEKYDKTYHNVNRPTPSPSDIEQHGEAIAWTLCNISKEMLDYQDHIDSFFDNHPTGNNRKGRCYDYQIQELELDKQ